MKRLEVVVEECKITTNDDAGVFIDIDEETCG